MLNFSIKFLIIYALLINISYFKTIAVGVTAQQFKQKMQNNVKTIAKSLEQVINNKCNNQQLMNCKEKSILACQGTGERTCMTNFPLSNDQPLMLSQSSNVKTPNAQNPNSLRTSIRQFICGTATTQISSRFYQLVLKNNQTYAWIYAGSRDGIHVKSPGENFSAKDSITGACKDYDSRLRPWFIQSVYGRKNVIILIGNNNNFALSNQAQLTTTKASAFALLNSSYVDDKMAIITFSDKAQSILPLNQLVNLDESDKLNNTSTYKNQFYKKISEMKAGTTNQLNYEDAFGLAFDMINYTQNSSTTVIDSKQYIFIVMASSNPNKGLNTYSQLMSFINNKTDQINLLRDSTNKIKISLVGLNVDSDTSNNLMMKDWSCLNNGMFINIGNVKVPSRFLSQASELYDYQILNNYVDKAIWSPIYPDSSQMGQMVTVTYPVYQTVNNVKRLFAVIGLDVLVSAFQKYSSAFTNLNDLLNQGGRRFVKNATDCQIQNFRKFKCQNLNCSSQVNFECLSKTIDSVIFKQPTQRNIKKYCDISNSLSGGQIVGIVVGAVIFLLIVILLICYKMNICCFDSHIPIDNLPKTPKQEKINKENQQNNFKTHKIKNKSHQINIKNSDNADTKRNRNETKQIDQNHIHIQL